MPIFGQVWLWSLLAFLLGAVLCWVLVVLPVRRRLDSLERRLAMIRTEPKPVAEPAAPSDYPRSSPGIVPALHDLDSQDEIRAESLTRAYALPGLDIPPADHAEELGALRLSDRDDPPMPPASATSYLSSRGAPTALDEPQEPPPVDGRDWFDDVRGAESSQRRGEHHLVDDHDDLEDSGTIFTQRTMPIPMEAIRQLDESQPAHALDESAPAHALVEEPIEDESLVDDLEEEEEEPPATHAPAARYVFEPRFEPSDQPLLPVREPEPEPFTYRPDPAEATNLLFAPNGSASVTEEPEPEPEPLPVARPQDDRISLVARNTVAEGDTKVAPGITIQPEPMPTALPKRIPSKPQHRVPFGVQTTSPAAAVSTSTTGERMRSLFEPIVPAEGELTMPPPHRVHGTDSRLSAPGPFGPGSAMPLPGGASPSPEFTIKASVTALRYCTPESPQFGRTVAEVWFRSAADAERVGFRPVG